jgi:transposase
VSLPLSKGFVFRGQAQDSIAIAFARAHSRDDLQFVGTTRYSVISLTKSLSKLGAPSEISVCHEAGPCGYGLVRALREQGYHCEVVAPSRVARRPADRIKTDRRDAPLLARLHRAGELVPVTVPEPQDEAIRDLVRAREDAVSDQRRVRQRLKSFLLRHGHAYTGTRWGPKHEHFLSKIRFEDSAQHIVFTEYRMAVRFATELGERLTQSLRAHAETWRWLPMVKGLMTLRSMVPVQICKPVENFHIGRIPYRVNGTAFHTAGAAASLRPSFARLNWSLRMRCINSMPDTVVAALLNRLKPSITFVLDLMW